MLAVFVSILLIQLQACSAGGAQPAGARIARLDGTTTEFTVGAVYNARDIAGNYLVPREAWAPHAVQDIDTTVLISLDDDVPLETGRQAVEQTADAYGAPDIEDRDQYALAMEQLCIEAESPARTIASLSQELGRPPTPRDCCTARIAGTYNGSSVELPGTTAVVSGMPRGSSTPAEILNWGLAGSSLLWPNCNSPCSDRTSA